MKRTSCLGFLAFAALFTGHASAQAAPKLLPFQGRLTDATGAAVADGVKVVQFKIYNAPVGGQAVWNGEVQKLTVNGSLVNTILGSKASLSGVDFNQNLYLELTLDANNDGQITLADPPLLPRQSILPAVFSIESADSRNLAGFNWTPIFGTNNPNLPIPATKLAENSLPGSKIQAASITSNQLAPQTVSAAQIANSTITSNQVANGSIDVSDLAQQVAEALCPPGTVMAFAGTNVPSGWILCDGRPLRSSDYPRLWQAIRTAWGSAADDADGSTDFRVPDFRGLFLRGVDFSPVTGESGRDPDRGDAGRGQIAQGGASGNRVGSWQSDALANHRHDIWGYTTWNSSASATGIGSNNPANYAGIAAIYEAGNQVNSPPWTRGFSGFNYRGEQYISSTGGSESRPKNAYVNYIIKY